MKNDYSYAILYYNSPINPQKEKAVTMSSNTSETYDLGELKIFSHILSEICEVSGCSIRDWLKAGVILKPDGQKAGRYWWYARNLDKLIAQIKFKEDKRFLKKD